jgi:hypothetical protein
MSHNKSPIIILKGAEAETLQHIFHLQLSLMSYLKRVSEWEGWRVFIYLFTSIYTFIACKQKCEFRIHPFSSHLMSTWNFHSSHLNSMAHRKRFYGNIFKEKKTFLRDITWSLEIEWKSHFKFLMSFTDLILKCQRFSFLSFTFLKLKCISCSL